MPEPIPVPHAFLSGGGETGARMRAHRWSDTPLGPPEGWPEALRAMVSVVLNSALLGTVLWGPELRLLYNDTYAAVLAERHPDALGRPLPEVWADIWPLISPSFLGVLRTGEPHFATRFALPMTRDGRMATTYWNYSVAAIRDGAGEIVGLLNQALETTGEVEAEMRLRASEQHLDALIRASSEVRYRMNADFTVLLRLSGGDFLREVTEADPDWLRDHIPAQDLDRLRETAERATRTGEDFVLEHRVYRADGTVGWASSRAVPLRDAEGRVTGWLGAASDITDRRRAQEALLGRNVTLTQLVDERTAELRLYRDIVQSDSASIVAFDREHRLIGFNRAHAEESLRIMGRAQATGESLPDLLPPDQAEMLRGLMDRALAGERFTVVRAFGDPAGEMPSWEITYTPLRDADGGIVGAFHHARDVSQRVRAGAELRGVQDQLRQSQKMEAVGQLTGGLAHDFNNLLTGIIGSLELLGARVAQGRISDLGRYVAAAQGAATRAAALTHRLLAFSRRQTLDPKPTDVNRLVSEMEELIRRTVTPSVPVEIVGAGGLWTTLVDPNQLENALLNLCINARDAMPDGGRLTIETANRWLDERAALERDLPPGQYLSLCVTDTGAGMTPEVAAKAFDPFFTTKPLGAGTGLGLSMIYGFVRQSGGQARIYSEPDRGTMVCLYLPRYLGDTETAEPMPELAAAPRAGSGETVLVVDDEPTIRMLVVEVLEELGYDAIEAADGPSGLRVLQSGARIDLLVTDVGLPGGLNGRQMADAARAHRPDLRVLFITGYAENAVVGNGHLEHGMHVMTKPFAMEALANRVKRIIADPR